MLLCTLLAARCVAPVQSAPSVLVVVFLVGRVSDHLATRLPALPACGLFADDIAAGAVPNMMYGFGDVKRPRADTVKLLDDIIVDYIAKMVSLCLHI